jgi:hypothetical protein
MWNVHWTPRKCTKETHILLWAKLLWFLYGKPTGSWSVAITMDILRSNRTCKFSISFNCIRCSREFYDFRPQNAAEPWTAWDITVLIGECLLRILSGPCVSFTADVKCTFRTVLGTSSGACILYNCQKKWLYTYTSSTAWAQLTVYVL